MHVETMIRTASLLGCVALTVLPTSEAVAQTELPAITVDEAKPARKKRAKPIRRPSVQPQAAATIPATTPSAETLPPAPTPLATPAFLSQSETTASRILSRGGASLGDTAGVSATSFSPVASRPVIRGLGGFRVRTQENGISSADMANLGEDHAVTIDPLIAGNVEVIRGPGTLRYGSQAIGGVVSATTGRIPTAIPANGVAFKARSGLNSVSRGTDGAVLLDAGGGNVTIHADAFARKAGDYRIPGGVQENSSYRSDGHAVGGSYIFDSGFVGVAYQEMAMTYFVPGIDSAKVKNHIDLHQSKWTGRGEWRVGEYGLDAIRYWFGATNYKHNEINGIGPAEEIGSRFRNEELESRVEVSHLPFMTALGEWRGTAGAQWGQRNLSVAGATEPLLAPAKARNIAAFAFEELQLTPAFEGTGRRARRAYADRRHRRAIPRILSAAARPAEPVSGEPPLHAGQPQHRPALPIVVRHRCACNAAARRAFARPDRDVLQGAARHPAHVRDRRSEHDVGKSRHGRDRSLTQDWRDALRCLALRLPLPEFHLQELHRRPL